MADIKCTVNDCHFYGKGDVCQANEIEVSVNFAGETDMEASMIGGDAGTSNRTKCVTYKPKK